MSISLRVLGVLLAAVPVLPAYAQTETPTPSITPKIIKVIQEGKSTQTMNTAVSTAAVTAGKPSESRLVQTEALVFSRCLAADTYWPIPVQAGQRVIINASINATCDPRGWSNDNFATS